MNKSFEDKSIDVLIENEMKGQNKLFGRNKYYNSVILRGDKNNIGKTTKVKIKSVVKKGVVNSFKIYLFKSFIY